VKSDYLKTIAKKTIWMVIGSISALLGILGIILPGLPTTPFLLITIIAYSKGSKRFYTWFIQTRYYKKYLQSIHERNSMTRKHKKILMLWSDLVVLISFIMVNHAILRVMLIGLVIIKYWYFHYFVTITDSSQYTTQEISLNKSNHVFKQRIEVPQ
jgi:uncharacterized protein